MAISAKNLPHFLFFDFDGVLVTGKEINLYSGDKCPYKYLKNNSYLHYIDRILKGYKTEAYFIPISSWSSVFKDISVLKKYFEEEKFEALKIYEPQHYINTNGWHKKAKLESESRPYIIKDFIKSHKIKEYLIFDDECTVPYLFLGLKHIKTSMYDGITGENFHHFNRYVYNYWRKN